MASGGCHTIKRPATTAALHTAGTAPTMPVFLHSRGPGSPADSWVSGCGWASRPQQSSIAWTNGFERPVSRNSNPADSPRCRVPGGVHCFARAVEELNESQQIPSTDHAFESPQADDSVVTPASQEGIDEKCLPNNRSEARSVHRRSRPKEVQTKNALQSRGCP